MELDHLAVAGKTLEEASAHVEQALGVAMQPGGQHARFGTHNMLLGLGDGLYLEAIAIDPKAPSPGRMRWFDLDHLDGPPHLRCWICRVPDLDAALMTAPPGCGDPIELERGDLKWKMAVPDTGILPYDNVFPALIQWRGDLHPANMLADSGCRLRSLTVSHPDVEPLRGDLEGIALVRVERGEPGLVAEIETPHGVRVLE
ncbi:VOC family protein [Lutimaribacter marinistellae]|uniref:VOC family protein n=1 Tax=Lutimaribacter marinistellae TaxID=1820329 RepID=A0ABV7TJW0_9RHOB